MKQNPAPVPTPNRYPPSRSYYNEARDHESGRMTGDNRFDWRDCVGQYRLYYLVRCMHLLATLLCVLIVVAWIVNVANFAGLAGLYDEASVKAKDEMKEKIDDSYEKLNHVAGITLVLEAAVLVFMAGGFLLFFPACIVMFRRVERRLDAIIQEMNLRSDVGTVFLPYEFSAPSSRTLDRTQIEMQIVEARTFLGSIKSAAAAQRQRFGLCLALVLAALVVFASNQLFVVFFSITLERSSECASCGKCQTVRLILPSLYFCNTLAGTTAHVDLVQSHT